VAPADRRPQRLLPRQGRPSAGREDVEAPVEPRRHLCGRERLHACRGKLERERHSLEPRAELPHLRQLAFGGREYRIGIPGAGEKELERFVRRQPGHLPRPFTAAAKPFTARGEDRHLRAALEDRLGERRAGGDHVLAGVEHEQHANARELVGNRLGGGAPRGHADPDAGCRRVAHELRVRDRGELDEDDPVARAVRGPRSRRNCEARLPTPSRPCQRQHSRL
jgi:hypothetical protein